MRTSLSNNIALDLPSSLKPEAIEHGPLVLSPRLHNKDLAPTKVEGRRWGRYSIFALWTNDVHNIANYSFAIGLYALGLGGWQIQCAGNRHGLLYPGTHPVQVQPAGADDQ